MSLREHLNNSLSLLHVMNSKKHRVRELSRSIESHIIHKRPPASDQEGMSSGTSSQQPGPPASDHEALSLGTSQQQSSTINQKAVEFTTSLSYNEYNRIPTTAPFFPWSNFLNEFLFPKPIDHEARAAIPRATELLHQLSKSPSTSRIILYHEPLSCSISCPSLLKLASTSRFILYNELTASHQFFLPRFSRRVWRP